MRDAYLVMEPATWFVLVPLAVASLLIGLLQALGRAWGVFRHYWVIFRLGINVACTLVLLLYMETFGLMSDVAADPSAELSAVRTASPVLHGAVALMLLLVATYWRCSSRGV